MSSTKLDAPMNPLTDVKASTSNPESSEIATDKSNPQPGPSAGSRSFLNRAMSKDSRQTARRFFSAYAEAWVGMSPIWLMGEAITGQKVGTKFNKGKAKLFAAAEEVSKAVATSSRDVVVIVDEKLRGGKEQAGKTAEVLKAAGEDAILVVTTSLEKLQADLLQSDVGPELKKAMASNGRDVLVILDKALKHPVVVTGVTRFAKSQGIPHADALLRLSSLALARILRAMPEEARESEVGQKVQQKVEEIDAAELERTSSAQDKEEAKSIGEQAGVSPTPKVEDGDPYAEMRKRNNCFVM